MKYAIAFDLGTGSVKASIFNENADNLGNAVIEYRTIYKNGGIREQNPNDWWESVKKAASILLTDFKYKNDIAAIGLSGHSLGVVAVDVDGKLLADSTPIWSDARATRQADLFFNKIDKKSWYDTTGCGFPSHLYSLFKIMWYKDNNPELYNRTYKFIGTKDYINLKLTGVIGTDRSYASGSGAYSLKEHDYRKEYIQAAGLDDCKFSEIHSSNNVIGKLQKKLAAEWGLNDHVLVVYGGVDNACMSLGAGCYESNDLYISLGSSAWVAACTDTPVLDYDKKIYTWEHCVAGMYIPSAGIFSSGTSLDWVKEKLFENYSYKEFDDLAGSAPVGSNGVVFCPVLSGGSGVDASENMRGGFSNFDLKNTKADLARATLEGISYDLSLALDVIASKISLSENLLAVGGGAKSDIWLQIYADILDKNILSSSIARDAASLGAAALAFMGAGIWSDYRKIKKKHQEGFIFERNFENVKVYRKRKKVFNLVCKQMAILSTLN